jgi:DNA-binding NtrC family response regulator
MKLPTSEEKSRTSTNSIIMVDDEPDANITIKIALEENGDFEVDTFNDAESALLAFKSGHYDLAIPGVQHSIHSPHERICLLSESICNM